MAKDPMKFMYLLRSWTTFWIMVISMVVTFSVTFATLQHRVSAMEIEHEELEEEVESKEEILIEVRDAVIRMEKDIEFIKENLN